MSVPLISDPPPEPQDSFTGTFELAYGLGFRTGLEIGEVHGYARAGLEVTAAITGVRQALGGPTQNELDRRRTVDHQPCPARCSRCSRCIHSLAYWRRGGRDYLGVDGEARLAQAQAGAA